MKNVYSKVSLLNKLILNLFGASKWKTQWWGCINLLLWLEHSSLEHFLLKPPWDATEAWPHMEQKEVCWCHANSDRAMPATAASDLGSSLKPFSQGRMEIEGYSLMSSSRLKSVVTANQPESGSCVAVLRFWDIGLSMPKKMRSLSSEASSRTDLWVNLASLNSVECCLSSL